MRGTQTPRGNGDGANGSGEPLPRPLLRPSPSANLVGNWKGDPLGSRHGVGTPSGLPNTTALPHRSAINRRGAQRHRRSVMMKRTLLFLLVLLVVCGLETWWLSGRQPRASTALALKQLNGGNSAAANVREFEAAKELVHVIAGAVTLLAAWLCF